MYICVCKGITDSALKQAIVDEGCQTMSQIRKSLDLGTCCGSCVQEAKSILKQSLLDIETQKKLEKLAYVA